MKYLPSLAQEYKKIIEAYPREKISEFKITFRNFDNPPIGITQLRDLALSCLYLLEKKSGYQIVEEFPNLFLNKDFRPLTARGILHILRKYQITRSMAVSSALRIKTGRMRYENRRLDYRRRSREQYKDWAFAPGLLKILQVKNISIDLLAKKIGVQKRNIYAWGACKSKVSLKNQEKIINGLDVTYKDIFTKKNVRRIKRAYFLKKKGHLARNLDQYLKSTQLTKEELGQLLGVPGYIITNWKQERTFVAPKFVNKITKIFNAQAEDIFVLGYRKN